MIYVNSRGIFKCRWLATHRRREKLFDRMCEQVAHKRHFQIESYLQERILSGEWPTGFKIRPKPDCKANSVLVER